MTYDLYIGNRMYSSWSLRGWLMLEKFDLPYRSHLVGLYSGTMAADLAAVAPARTVPAMATPEGFVLTDSIAMAETLAERHPDAGLLPTGGAARALARSMIAEIHSGYGALRGDCPMLLSHIWDGFAPSAAVLSDVARITHLWHLSRDRHGASGPWLFGAYSVADVFYAPVAARIATYGLPTDNVTGAYVDMHLADPSFRRWRAMADAETPITAPYPQDLLQKPWPFSPPLVALAVADGPSENATCPYSGEPVVSFMKLGDRTFGFCNNFCRDKTMVDPAAWPQFMALLAR